MNSACCRPADDLDQQDLPDLQEQRIAQLEARLSRLEARLQGEYPPDRPQEDERFQLPGYIGQNKSAAGIKTQKDSRLLTLGRGGNPF